jgi:hypothetical protein
MTLGDAISHLGSLNGRDTIYAAEPWAPGSQAVVAAEPDDGGLPLEAQKLGLTYFLEVFVAREFLEGWEPHLSSEPTI